MTNILSSKQHRPSAASSVLAALVVIIILIAVIAGVILGAGWLFATALSIPFWNGVALAVALIAVIWFGNAIVKRK